MARKSDYAEHAQVDLPLEPLPREGASNLLVKLHSLHYVLLVLKIVINNAEVYRFIWDKADIIFTHIYIWAIYGAKDQSWQIEIKQFRSLHQNSHAWVHLNKVKAE